MRELRLGDGPLEAVLLPEAGARLHRLRAFGQDLLRTPADPREHLRDPFFWGAYVMAPWCNRLPARPMRVGEHQIDLRANFADGSAIHGQVYARSWTLEPDGTTLRTSGGGDGWPWGYEVRLHPSVSGADLRLRLALRNASDAPMPAGLGIHPWWRRPVQVSVDGDRVYATNLDSPAAATPVEGSFDLRAPAEPRLGLDATWAGIGADGVRLAWPELGVAAAITLSASANHVAVAAPRDPEATAVEVQSHAPDGLRRLLNGEPGALDLLPPAAELAIEMTITVSRS